MLQVERRIKLQQVEPGVVKVTLFLRQADHADVAIRFGQRDGLSRACHNNTFLLRRRRGLLGAQYSRTQRKKETDLMGSSTVPSEWEKPGRVEYIDLSHASPMNKSPVDLWTVSLASPSPSHLSEDEITRANRFKFEEDRIRWTRARSSLRIILSRYAGDDPSRLGFIYGAHGKPALLPFSDIEFNLSHAGDWAMIAVGRTQSRWESTSSASGPMSICSPFFKGSAKPICPMRPRSFISCGRVVKQSQRLPAELSSTSLPVIYR